ncbi:MAG: hypothetical protein ACYS19_05230, partial [Planctomycetota bacterium]
MKSTKTMALIVLGLLAPGSAWLLPSVAGQSPENSLVKRVETLEALVAELTTRVETLEGQGSGDVLHLNLLDDFPDNPAEGDICCTKDRDSGAAELL